VRMTRKYVLGFALVGGITLGAPLTLSSVDAPVATTGGCRCLTEVVPGSLEQATTATQAPPMVVATVPVGWPPCMISLP
jgi:hypothetical protein